MQVLEFTHFACTSEDINNVSHALMLKAALEQCVLPSMDCVIEAMQSMATEHAGVYSQDHLTSFCLFINIALYSKCCIDPSHIEKADEIQEPEYL